jgi:hypothetical protein
MLIRLLGSGCSCPEGDLFLDKVFFFGSSLFRTNFFLSLIFGSYWLIVTWCIVLLLHPLPSVLLGLFVHLPFSFPLHGYAMNHGGVLEHSRRYPKYSRLTLPWILSCRNLGGPRGDLALIRHRLISLSAVTINAFYLWTTTDHDNTRVITPDALQFNPPGLCAIINSIAQTSAAMYVRKSLAPGTD